MIVSSLLKVRLYAILNKNSAERRGDFDMFVFMRSFLIVAAFAVALAGCGPPEKPQQAKPEVPPLAPIANGSEAYFKDKQKNRLKVYRCNGDCAPDAVMSHGCSQMHTRGAQTFTFYIPAHAPDKNRFGGWITSAPSLEDALERAGVPWIMAQYSVTIAHTGDCMLFTF